MSIFNITYSSDIVINQILDAEKKTCRICKEEKYKNEFNRNKSYKDGYVKHCKKCQSQIDKERREKRKATLQVDYTGKKNCNTCKQLLDKTCFSADYQKKDLLHGRCKFCCTVASQESKKKIKPESKDKSMQITSDQYNHILSLPCMWCGKLKDKRSVDRFNSDLPYIETNVVPSCSDCNKKKCDDTAEQWINFIKQFNPDYKPFIELDKNYQLIKPPLQDMIKQELENEQESESETESEEKEEEQDESSESSEW